MAENSSLLKRALTAEGEFTKEQVVDILFYLKEILGVILGVIVGLVGITGLPGICDDYFPALLPLCVQIFGSRRRCSLDQRCTQRALHEWFLPLFIELAYHIQRAQLLIISYRSTLKNIDLCNKIKTA